MVQFRCEHCHKDVTAPDSAGGKRGKCPYCKQTSYIPMPKTGKEEEIPLAPLDEEMDPSQTAEMRALVEMERQLLAEDVPADPGVPLEHRSEVSADDVLHLVVNYCMDIAGSNLDRAQMHVAKLKQFGYAGIEAADNILSGKTLEPALDIVPVKVLHGILEQLKAAIRGTV